MLGGSSVVISGHPQATVGLVQWLWQSTQLSVLGWQDDRVKGPTPLLCLHLLCLNNAGGVEHMECEIKLEGPISPDVEPGKEETEESKKRKRKPYRPGEALGWGMGWGGVAHPVPSGFSTSALPPHRHWWFHGATAEIPHTCEKGACCTGGGVEWGWAARRG